MEILTGMVKQRITYNLINEREHIFEISPDGKKLVTTRGQYPQNSLHFMMLSGDSLINIAAPHNGYFKWSQNSEFIIYLKEIDQSNHVWKMFLVDPDEPLNEIQLFDFEVVPTTPDIYFGDINTGIWDDY